MRGFLGAFSIFLLWTIACIYYISNSTETAIVKNPENPVSQNATERINSNSDMAIRENTINPSPKNTDQDIYNANLDATLNDENKALNGPDALESKRFAEEIKLSIAVNDSVDFEKDEPEVAFNNKITEASGPSFSSRIFYPEYNGTDLILDKNLVAYAPELRKLLEENPDKKVTIIGHTDYVGDSKDNFTSGLKKARQVKWYLTSRRGIPRHKVNATSRGEEEPIESNKSDWGRKKNNRIEIIVD